MREYHNGNEVGTSQLRWIGSSPPSLTKRLGAAGVTPGRPGANFSTIFEKTLDKRITLWYNIYRKRK